MGCIPSEITVDAAVRAAREEVYYGDLNENSTQGDIIKVYEKLDRDFPAENRVVEVPYDEIPSKLRNYLKLKEGESIMRYKGLVRRSSDASARAWRKMFGGDVERAIEISNRPHNIIKRDMGTTIHNVLENLGKAKTSKDRDNIITNTEEFVSKEVLINQLGWNREHVDKLDSFMENLIGFASKKQKLKDPTGKAKIYFERFIPDFSGDIGTTIDMMILYSDGTTSHYDFKTIYPYIEDREKLWRQNRELKADPDSAIPDFKIHQIIPQLRASKNIVLEKGLSKGVEENRALPINVQLEYKPKSKQKGEYDKYQPIVKYLAAGPDQDPAMKIIPVDERTGIKELDKKIEVYNNNLHNYSLKIQEFYNDPVKRAAWERRLKSGRKVLNSLIVDRDVSTMIDEAGKLLKRYYTSFHNLENVNEEYVTIEGKKTLNKAYLGNRELWELINELSSYHGVLMSSGEFIKEIGAHKDNAEKYAEYKKKAGILAMSIGDAIELLKAEGRERVMTPEEIESIADFSAPHFYQRNFRTFSQQNHPAIGRASDLVQEAYNSARLMRQTLFADLQGFEKRFDEYSKKTGLSQLAINNKLIYDKGKQKKMLHKKYKSELFKEFRQAQEDKNSSTVKKYLSLKENAETIRKEYRDTYIVNNDPSEKELEVWDKRHNFDNAIFNKRLYGLYYKINDLSEYYTDGYKELAAPGNEVLLEFWQYWQEKMGEFRKLAGFSDYEALPNNFLPWIMTDIIDMMSQGTLDLAGMKEIGQDLFKLKAYDQHAGVVETKEYINPATGEALREIPLFFTQPIRDKDGNVNHDLKSMNLLKSLLLFGDAVYNHHFLANDVEPVMEAIKDIIVLEGEKSTSDYGADKVLETGDPARKIGKDTKTYQLFDAHLNKHLYGLNIQDVDRKTAKLLGQVKRYQMLKELGFAVLSPAGNFLQIETNIFFEASKGYYFNKTHLKNTTSMMSGAQGKDKKDLAKAIIYLIEPVDGKVSLQGKSLELNAVQKFFTMDTAMLGYRLGEHTIENQVLLSVMQNYGIDESGNLKRIKNLPTGTKSLLDNSSIKDEKLHIEGITKSDGTIDVEMYTKLRTLSVSVSRGVKGGKRSQDDIGANYSMLGNLFMAFKSWMPGMIDERASPIRYERGTGAIIEGKYTAWLTDVGLSKAFNESEATWLGLISEVIIPSAFRLLLYTTTFGWLFKGDYQQTQDGATEFSTKHPLAYKVNIQRAKVLFENFKARYPNSKEIQAMSFEDFLDYKQGQIRSLAAELFVILSLFGLVGYMKGEDDDGERRWRNNTFTRTNYRLFNRWKREISFFVNYNDLRSSVLRQPIPQLGLFEDIIRWGQDTKQQALDFARDEPKKTTPFLYRTSRFVPSHKFFQTFEVYTPDTEREY